MQGTGYTNHCPRCLWSKHVDVNPGDRAAVCGGLMEPIAVEGISSEFRLVHRCVRCGYERKNIVAPEDDRNALVAIAENRGMRDT